MNAAFRTMTTRILRDPAHCDCMPQIDEEQWWDIDREELPPDRQVFQDFN